MAKLFGFSIEDSDDKKSPGIVSPVPPNKEDGVDHYLSSGFFGSYVDIEGVYRTEFDLIKRYREMALHPECDSAIEDIVNEAIVSDTNDSPIQIDLDNLNASDGIKKKIRQEFKGILELLDFDKKSHEIYRNWYVDGRLYYHKVIDLKNPESGIQELRYIDALKMRYVRQTKKKEGDKYRLMNRNINNPMDYEFPEIEEYFTYDPKMSYPTGTPIPGSLGGSNAGIKMTKDSITYCTSGLVDRNKGSTLSYLHKAIKSLNQLRMIEDSLVIYRLCLVGDTRVKTDNGYSYIKDIQVGNTVYSYDNRIDKLVKTKVTNKWLTGTKQTYKVKSKHHSVVGTDTHPILVYDLQTKDVKYIPIKDLVPKRHCLTYIKPEENATLTSFPEVREKSFTLKDDKIWSSYNIKNKEKTIEELSNITDIKKTKIRNFLYGNQSLESSNVALLKENLKILESADYEEKYTGFCKNGLNLPEYVDEEFSRLFGFLIGDGSIAKYGVTFAEGEDEIQNLYYSKLMKKFFGNCNRINSIRKYSNYTSSNTLASELLVKLGFISGAKNKRIPKWVFNSPNNIKREFILGLLDANGHYRDLTNGFSCEISLSNKQLIEDIKEVWTSLGLCSGHIRHRIREESTRKIGIEETPRTMPKTECWDLYLSEYELPKFEKIEKIESLEVEDVYDIEVEHEKHNFVANGIIVHNSRAPERRIFYIDVGNLPKVKAEQYLRDVMMRYRNKLVYDACLSMDTKVPLLDGRTLTLSGIAEEFSKGERLWTYSCDPTTGKFAPGIISWAGVTRKNEKVMRITLDNDRTITCTLDHKFPVWNKGNVEAKDLQVGDSMIPFYSREIPISSQKKNSPYIQIFDNESKKWKFVHRLVSQWKDSNEIENEWTFNNKFLLESKNTIHHMNYDRYNNTPENLMRMSRDDHFDYHKQHCSYAGKIGGKVCAQRKRELGMDFFNISSEHRSKFGKIFGHLGGTKSLQNKSGIHSLSKKEIVKNSIKGSKSLNQKLQSDEEFRGKFRQSISDGWGEKQRIAAVERGKEKPNTYFIEMNKLANISRWQGENSEEQRKSHSNKQTIEYTEEIYSLVEECVSKMFSLDETLNYLNENISFGDWKELNSGKNPRKGKSTTGAFKKFSYNNLTNVCKNKGFSSFKEYKNSFVYHNHKIKNIEFLDETMDVGTLTIDKEEIYNDYHTFALDVGIYTCNSTGEIRDDKKFMAMLEDFWLPRREGGRGTEITTLPGGQNLGEITDIEYFKKKLYRSLNVPSSRMDGEGGFNLGRSSEILRDEVKFSKFVSRLRKRFSYMFSDMLRTQLILKNIITPEDWKIMDEHIQYDFLYDNHFAELKDAELLNERLNMVQVAEPYVGKYFSQDYLRRKVLRQTDEEILEQDKLIKKEIEDGVIPDPNAQPIDPETGMPMDQTSQMDLGQPVNEPDLRSQESETQASGKPVEMPKGGEI